MFLLGACVVALLLVAPYGLFMSHTEHSKKLLLLVAHHGGLLVHLLAFGYGLAFGLGHHFGFGFWFHKACVNECVILCWLGLH